MTNDEKNQRTVHNVIMENRKSLTISGVTDVDSFDERCISLYTQMGELVIRGRELHINSMSVETGDMTIDGDIWALNTEIRIKEEQFLCLVSCFVRR